MLTRLEQDDDENIIVKPMHISEVYKDFSITVLTMARPFSF